MKKFKRIAALTIVILWAALIIVSRTAVYEPTARAGILRISALFRPTAEERRATDRRMAVGRPAGRQAFRPADRRIQRIRLATISARSHTSVVVPRTSAFLHNGQAVTIASAPVAVSSSATDVAMRT